MVFNGQLANQTTFNNGFVSRTAATTSTVSQTTFSNTTQSTDKDTGAIILEGGMGIEKNLNIGGAFVANGTILGSNLTGTNTGDMSLDNFGNNPNPTGLSLIGQVLKLEPADSTNPGGVSTGAQTFAGDKTFNDDVVIQGSLQINGALTYVNTTDLEVTDKNIVVNKGGNDASSQGAGVTVERTSTFGSFIFDAALASFWKIGLLGSESEIITAAFAQIITAVKTFSAKPLMKLGIDFEDPGAGANVVRVAAPAALAASYDFVLPPDDGVDEDFFKTDGAGNNSYVAAVSALLYNNTQTPAAGGQLTPHLKRVFQNLLISGNGGAVTLNVLPFSATPPDGTMICLIGNSDANTVTIVSNDAAGGCIMDGDILLKKYYSITLQYQATQNRYVERGRSFL